MEKADGWVGSGSFRLDAKRALEVLRSHQIETDESRIGLWVRAAVFRGATAIDFRWRSTRLAISFDGRPLSEGELLDPFSALLAEDGAVEPAARWLGTAMLHTAVPEVRVEVASGPPGARRAAVFDGGRFRLTEKAGRGRGTIVTVRWPFLLGPRDSGPHPFHWDPAALRSRLAACPVAVSAPKRERSLLWRPARMDHRGYLNAESRRGEWSLLLMPAEGGSGLSVSWCVGGVALGGEAREDFPIPVSAWLEAPGLALDAALRQPVRDGVYEASLAWAREAASAYALRLLRRHGHAMGLAAGLLAERPRLMRHWLEPRSFEELTREPSRSGDARRIQECSAMARYLRAAAKSSLLGRGSGRDDPVRAALRKAPLTLDGQGRLYTFESYELAMWPDIPGLVVHARR